MENVEGRLKKQLSRTKSPRAAWGSGGSFRMVGTLGRIYTEIELWTVFRRNWMPSSKKKLMN